MQIVRASLRPCIRNKSSVSAGEINAGFKLSKTLLLVLLLDSFLAILCSLLIVIPVTNYLWLVELQGENISGKHVVVLGKGQEPKAKGRRESFITNKKPRPQYNHCKCAGKPIHHGILKALRFHLFLPYLSIHIYTSIHTLPD